MIKMISPERCFQLYLAIKTHFTNMKYDVIKHNGRIKNTTKAAFEVRTDKGLFVSMSKKFTDVQHAASYLTANFAYGNMYPMTDPEKSDTLYTRWQRNRQSLYKIFCDDLDTISAKGLSYEELISTEKIPPLFIMLKSGSVNIETLTIMNRLENFSEQWKPVFHLWKDDLLRIKKLESFIKFDEAKFTNAYNTFKETLVHHHEEA